MVEGGPTVGQRERRSAEVTVLVEPGPDGRLGVARSTGAVVVSTDRAAAWILVEGGEGPGRGDWMRHRYLIWVTSKIQRKDEPPVSF